MFVCALAWSSLTWAQSANQTLAESLFDQATKLMGEGKYSEACPKLAESQRLDPGGGTLINLGLCREKEGKLGSAWAAFNEALGLALRDNRKDRETIARDHIAAIEPKLQKVVIVVSREASQLTGLTVDFDGAPIRSAAWGVPMATDEGLHTVTAKAPGKRDWKWDFEVKAEEPEQTVTVPALDDVPQPTKKKSSPLPWIVGSIGVAGLGIGIAGGLVAITKHSDANSLCGASDACTSQRGVDAENAATSAAWVANIGLIAGAVTIGVAVIMLVTSGRDAKPTAAWMQRGFVF